MILHLGVVDIPYAGAPSANAPFKPFSGVTTTGDVATWLENKYHVMEIFYHANEDMIVNAITDSYENTLRNMFAGSPVPNNPLKEAEAKITARFKDFLSRAEIEALGIPGVPTGAAKMGINHRFKHPYAKANPRRPSFIDTGLYQSTFVAWFD